ncbi:hypothetical protein GTH32_18095 [Alteromonas sp. 345S023]|uniref:GIY-YIG domain-containing protein n=1 Tax=Alteromonas profundi TaxID=2696062 RepID=A0A7X5LPC0_9ALTE|nr:GIY-YIG nuclease family protein [Alteromonas profundi]NDV93083.1 hypothetical protein [Alteromonas profundi]
MKRYLSHYEAFDNPRVAFRIFSQRLKNAEAKREVTDEYLEDAVRLSVSDFKRKYGTRKSYVVVNNNKICINDVFTRYKKPTVSYGNFRARLRTYVSRLKQFGFTHDERIFMWAATTESKEWSRIIGAGKAQPFRYTGKHFTDFSNRYFCSLYCFLLFTDLHERFKLVRSRLKQKWPIDRALLEAKKRQHRSTGFVYCITCSPTGKKYIGITSGSVARRFDEHVKEASRNSSRPLARAIAEFGVQSFTAKALHSNVPIDSLGDLEKQYIASLNTLYPSGLNANRGGQVSHTAGRSVEIDGVAYESYKQASEVISESSDGVVPPYIVESRLRAGEVELSELRKPCRRMSRHIEAGSALFRRYKGLLRRNVLCARWTNYDLFKKDVLAFTSFDYIKVNRLILIRKKSFKKFSKQNFEWVTKAEATIKRCGKKTVVYGVEYGSVEAVSRFFGVPASTLRYIVKKRSVSIEAAVSMILDKCVR